MRWIMLLLALALLPHRVSAGPTTSTVIGRLEIVSLDSKVLAKARTLRVWLPPAYDDDRNAHFDVLYLHDAQNCFDAATSAFGKEWRLDETLTQLIASKAIPQIVVVAIDNGGADRLNEMTFDADRKHGGGGAAKYADFLLAEVMPWANQHYRINTGPDHTTVGGSSLGGLVSLEIVRRHPGVFGGVMAMSPSLWWNDASLLAAVKQLPGGLADARVFLSIGERENFKSADDPENKQAVEQTRELFQALGGATHMTNTTRPQRALVITPDAVHDENAWSARLPEALMFFYGKINPTTTP